MGTCFSPKDVWRENIYAEEKYPQWLGSQSVEFILLTDHLMQNGNDVYHLLVHLTFLNFFLQGVFTCYVLYNCFNKQQLFSHTVLIGWFCNREAIGDVR